MVTVTAIMIILIIILIIIITTTIKMIIMGTPPSTLYLSCSKKKNRGMPLSFLFTYGSGFKCKFWKSKSKIFIY